MNRIMQLTSYGALNACLALTLYKDTQDITKSLAGSVLLTAVIAIIATFSWYMLMGAKDHYVPVQNEMGEWRIGRYNINDPMYLIPGVFKTHKEVKQEIKRIKKLLGWNPNATNCVG